MIKEWMKKFEKIIEGIYLEAEASYAENLHVDLRAFISEYTKALIDDIGGVRFNGCSISEMHDTPKDATIPVFVVLDILNKKLDEILSSLDERE